MELKRTTGTLAKRSARRRAKAVGLVISILTIVNISSGDIYIDGALSSTSCTTYDPSTRSCGSGTSTAYRTISAAASAAVPGTTVIFRAGTYSEQLRPANSGTAANRIVFKNFGQEAVYIRPSTGPGVNLSDRSYITLEGLRVEDITWLEARNTHHTIIQRCTFRRNPNGGTTGNVRFISSTYNRILDSIIEDGNDNIVLIDSNYNLIQGNTIREGRHSVLTIRCSDFNIIRSNYLANSQQKIGEVYDCGGDTSAVPNSFNSTKHNIFEGNIFAEAVTEDNPTTSNGNGIQYSGQDGIIRNNVFHSCYVGLAMQYYGDEALYTINNRVYHNVFYNNDGGGIAIRPNTVSNIFQNNILLDNKGCNPDCTAVSPGQIIYRTPLHPTTRIERNSILYQAAGDRVMEPEFSAGSTIAQFSSANPGVMTANLEVNPLFVNAPANDFRLQSGSPMIDQGVFLTTTVSGDSGTTIPVRDAWPFYDGFGIPWETGDLIQLQGQTQTARIVAVSYTANTLTVDRPLTWTAGQGVSLRFAGAAPDIGAFETGGSNGSRPSPPQNLRIVSP